MVGGRKSSPRSVGCSRWVGRVREGAVIAGCGYGVEGMHSAVLASVLAPRCRYRNRKHRSVGRFEVYRQESGRHAFPGYLLSSLPIYPINVPPFLDLNTRTTARWVMSRCSGWTAGEAQQGHRLS